MALPETPRPLKTLLSLDGSEVSVATTPRLKIFSNGHGRPVVTNGRWAFTIGLDPPLWGPTVEIILGGYGLFTGESSWYVFTQYYSSERGVGSNLSMASTCPPNSPAVFAQGQNGLLRVTLNATLGIGQIISGKTPFDWIDRVRIWLWDGINDAKMVQELLITRLTYDLNIQKSDYDAIGGDFSIPLAGFLDQPVSIGRDVFPACEYVAYAYNRLIGYGQTDYKHPGHITIYNKGDVITDPDFASLSLGANWMPGREKSLVILNPNPSSYRWMVYWIHSTTPFTGIVLSVDDLHMFVIINGITILRVYSTAIYYPANDPGYGHVGQRWWIRKGIVYNDTATPTNRGGNAIEWDETLKAIRINVEMGANPDPANYWGALLICEDGYIRFERPTTRTDDANPLFTNFNAGDVPNPIMNTREWGVNYRPVEIMSRKAGKVNIRYWVANPTGAPSAGTGELQVGPNSEIIENAAPVDLWNVPLFQDGLRYKALTVQGNFLGNVWRLAHERALWLDRRVRNAEKCNDEPFWKIIGIKNAIFYSNYGYPEGGKFMDAITSGQRGNVIWSDLALGGAHRARGLSMGQALEVIAKEREFLVNMSGTDDPLNEESLAVSPKSARGGTFAPRTIARDQEDNRLSVINMPLGIGKSEGAYTGILTDAAGNQALLAEDVDATTLENACGAFYSDKGGFLYVLGNMDRPGEAGGEHGLVTDFRGTQIHITKLDDMQIRSMAVMVDDAGKDVLIYGTRDGEMGKLFQSPLDREQMQGWRSRFFISIVDLLPATIHGVGLYCAFPPDSEFFINVEIYGVGGAVRLDDVKGDLTRWQGEETYRRVVFSETMVNGAQTGRNIFRIEPIRSSGFVIELSGRQEYAITNKGVVLMIDVPGLPEDVEGMMRK